MLPCLLVKHTALDNTLGLVLILAAALTAALFGCSRTPGGKSPEPAASEQSEEQILQELRQGVAPLTSVVVPAPNVVGWGSNGTGAAANVTPEVREQVLSFLRSAVEKYGSSDAGKAALNKLSDDLADTQEKAWEQERWRAVMTAIECYEIIVPGSVRMARLRQRAQVRMNRPDVVVKGFFNDRVKNDIYVFVEVTLHPGGEVKRMQVRKGEEFCGLRFADFVGNLRGILLEYLDIPGETFKAMGP